jgi:hypothetical protein
MYIFALALSDDGELPKLRIHKKKKMRKLNKITCKFFDPKFSAKKFPILLTGFDF